MMDGIYDGNSLYCTFGVNTHGGPLASTQSHMQHPPPPQHSFGTPPPNTPSAPPPPPLPPPHNHTYNR